MYHVQSHKLQMRPLSLLGAMVPPLGRRGSIGDYTTDQINGKNSTE